MTVSEILTKRKELENSMRYALTIHEKSDMLKTTRAALIALRQACPHQEGAQVCPYCGLKLS